MVLRSGSETSTDDKHQEEQRTQLEAAQKECTNLPRILASTDGYKEQARIHSDISRVCLEISRLTMAVNTHDARKSPRAGIEKQARASLLGILERLVDVLEVEMRSLVIYIARWPQFSGLRGADSCSEATWAVSKSTPH
jgi:hypothetical protein